MTEISISLETEQLNFRLLELPSTLLDIVLGENAPV